MRSAVYTAYGPPEVVQITDVEKPVPKDNEVLIRVRVASVNPLDYHIMRGKSSLMRLLFGLRKPRVRPGRDVAGEVEAIGRNVTQFKPGDAVFGNCSGAFAEYACAGDSAVAIKPEKLTFEQAASVPVAAFTALQGLRDKAHVQPGQTVLVNGAAGGVGTFAVQIAKSFGAEVTGVCSTRNLEMVRSIGADHVVDYTRKDFTQSGKRYDVIFDLVANHPMSVYRRALNSKGIYIGAGVLGGEPSMISALAGWIAAPIYSWFVSQSFATVLAHASKEDLIVLCGLMTSGKVTPVIDRRYPLSEVAEAIRYVEAAHARGKVVITLD